MRWSRMLESNCIPARQAEPRSGSQKRGSDPEAGEGNRAEERPDVEKVRERRSPVPLPSARLVPPLVSCAPAQVHRRLPSPVPAPAGQEGQPPLTASRGPTSRTVQTPLWAGGFQGLAQGEKLLEQ